MNKRTGIYKAHSPDKAVVLIEYDGEEVWSPVNDPVLSVLTGSKLITKGDTVEVSFGDGEQNSEETVVFIKNMSGGFKKAPYNAKPFKSAPKSEGGFNRSSDTQDQIMRQNAMNRVVDLICADKVEMDKVTMLALAESFLDYFKTGQFKE